MFSKNLNEWKSITAGTICMKYLNNFVGLRETWVFLGARFDARHVCESSRETKLRFHFSIQRVLLKSKSQCTHRWACPHTLLVFLNIAFCHRALAFVHAKIFFGAGKFRNALLSLHVCCMAATTLPPDLGSAASNCATILNTHLNVPSKDLKDNSKRIDAKRKHRWEHM